MRTITKIDAALAAAALPKRQDDGHKGSFGSLLVLGGCVGYTGAPYLCAHAAVHSGCGLVFLGVPQSIYSAEAAKCVCAMPFPLPEEEGALCPAALGAIEEKLRRCDVLALGPGLGRSLGAQALAFSLLDSTAQAVVLDADGINALEGRADVLDRRADRITVLTPHPLEFARLSGRSPEEVLRGDAAALAHDFACAHGCVLVLKGHRSIVALPDGEVLQNTCGGSALAKGGSGDVLAGLLASLLCQGAKAREAALCAVYLHARAGDLLSRTLTPYCVTPELLISQGFPAAFCELQ